MNEEELMAIARGVQQHIRKNIPNQYCAECAKNQTARAVHLYGGLRIGNPMRIGGGYQLIFNSVAIIFLSTPTSVRLRRSSTSRQDTAGNKRSR